MNVCNGSIVDSRRKGRTVGFSDQLRKFRVDYHFFAMRFFSLLNNHENTARRLADLDVNETVDLKVFALL